MMGRLVLLLGRWFCGAYVHPAIDLPTVSVDYLAVKLLRQRYGQARLARCRGADYQQDRGVSRQMNSLAKMS